MMHLSLKPVSIPFIVGDTVWVNHPCGESNKHPYFQATIIQIILDGSLLNSLVVRQRVESHELIISTGIYDLKPIGEWSQVSRVTVSVDLTSPNTTLFATHTELIDYLNAVDNQTNNAQN